MYDFSVIMCAFFAIGGAIWYSIKIVKDEVDPPPATWAILCWSITLLLAMYVGDPEWSITGNIALTSAFVDIWIVTIVLFLKLKIKDELKVSFNAFQKFTMVASALILMIWFVTSDELMAYSLMQLSMFIGYWPTIERLWKADHNTDSFVIWVPILLSCIAAIYPVYVSGDIFGWIFVGRAIPSTTFIIYLMLRHEINARAPKGISV